MTVNSSALWERLQFQKPQISLARPTELRMWLVSLCAFMAVFQSSLSDSFSSLVAALAAVAAAVLTEFLILRERKKISALMDGSAVASALILTLLLPNRISPVYAAAGAVFAIAVIKHSFGGLGSNWLNPAAGGWLFVRFSWPSFFHRSLDASPLSLVSDASGFSAAAAEMASSLDGALRSFLNGTVFSLTGSELPVGYIDLFASPFPGIIADRAVFALLLGTVIISATRLNRSWVPAVFLAVFCFLVRFVGALPYGGELWNGDLLFALCSGGTLCAAFFLAADPATGAKSNGGMILAAATGGAIAFVFRYYGGEAYGAVFAVLAINAMLPIIRVFESRRLYEKRYT